MADGWQHRRIDGQFTQYRSLIELLEARAAAPRGGYAFPQEGQGPAAELGFAALARQARAISAAVQARVAPGARALLLYPPGPHFLPAFFACLHAGVIAVPAPPPDNARLRHSLPRLLAILRDAGPELVLTTAALHGPLTERLGEALPRRCWLATDALDPGVEAGAVPGLDAGSLAYLQYTSGSTATPRGVMLTHGNVLRNLALLRRGFAYTEASRSVTWMPHFHDYGLVEGLLQPLYSDIPCEVLSPLAILRRPLRWLQAMDRHRATHTHGPNFAYELCLQRIAPEQRAALDLGAWEVAGNGAEPIRAETLRRFAEAFGPCGFRAEAFTPAYGLAEATLFVTARPRDRAPGQRALDAAALEAHRVAPARPDDPAPRLVVSCGVPQPGTDLRIVDPVTRRPCDPDRVGEIWVADASVAQGYWHRPESSAESFGARLAGEPEAGPFLRTGDLGFLAEGELYVTGRLKDLIIVAGANHYPQDIENSVEQACPELRRDHCAAFAITAGGEERLALLVEPERPVAAWEPLFRRIRRTVLEAHGLAVAAIGAVRRGGIPRTSSGKLQRQACRAAFLGEGMELLAQWREPPPASGLPADPPPRGDAAGLRQLLCRELGAILGIEPAAIEPHRPFAEYGLDSRRGMALLAALGDRLGGAELEPELLWRYPSVAALGAHLAARQPEARAAPVPPPPPPPGDAPIAIIGLACRFPGAPDAAGFRTLLREGRSAITRSPRLPGVEAGFLPEVEEFDAEFFGLSASEARAMDPQQRLLLEVAWEALEEAGLAPRHLAGRRAGVWIGISSGDHGWLQFARPDAAALIGAHSGTGLAHCMAANRLSYLLDLRGPSMAIDTACSSSLVAVHQACQSLRSGESEVAIAGGVNLLLGPHLHLALQRAGMLAPDGRCKAFDAAADGYARGEGCGVVVLKRLADAERDGDRVLAVIRGSAVNQDGRSNGLTAPNPQAQEAVIREALAMAGLAPSEIDLVEAHGTGTRLGDPIEVGALQAVLGPGRPPERRCLLGSVKTNIGHLEAAAGIAGLIRLVLGLRDAEVTPHLNCRTLNPLIRLEGTPFALATGPAPWPAAPGRPRRAAVSSFGFGGTNAHVVLEQAPPLPPAPGAESTRPLHLLALSARSPSALRLLAARHAALLAERPDTRLPELCATLATRRAHHPERLALRAADTAGLAAGLRAFAAGEAVPGAASGRAAAQPPPVVFLFTGQGAQYPGMARGLHATEPHFRETLEACDAELRGELEHPLLEVILGARPGLLDRTEYTQPALFAVEYALACLWRNWGIEPAAVMGHSVGEYVAACLAGVFDWRTGLRLIAARGRLIGELPPGGAMLAVAADEERLAEAVRDGRGAIALAAVNGPRSTVLAGERHRLEALAARLAGQGIGCRFLEVSHAFHSPLLDPVLDRFRALAAGIRCEAPRLPWIGNRSGQVVTAAPDADYWTRHLREPVRFADGLRHLDAMFPTAAGRIFLEIGPRAVLGPLGAQTLPDPGTLWLPSLHPGQEDWSVLLGSLARLYTAGVAPDWERFAGDPPRRLAGLPAYPFERRRHALPPPAPGRSGTDAVQQALAGEAAPGPEPVLALLDRGDAGALARRLAVGAGLAPERLAELEAWMRALVREHRGEAASGPQAGLLHEVAWEPRPRRPAPPQAPGRWLVLADRGGCGERLAQHLREAGVQVVLHPAAAEPPDLEAPFAGAAPGEPLGVVHLGALDAPPEEGPEGEMDAAALLAAQEPVCGAALRLVQRLLRTRVPPRLWLVTQGAVPAARAPGEPSSGTRWRIAQAPLWGLGRVIALEHPELWGGLIDLPLDGTPREGAEALAAALLDPEGEDQLALRAGQRLVPRLRPAAASPEAGRLRFRADATYLITGGLGALGRRVATWMVERGARHLVLAGRSPPDDAARGELAAIERAGARIRTVQADVAQEAAVARLLDGIRTELPPLRGILHAAALVEDGLLLHQESGRLVAGMAAKLGGAWALHRLTRDLALDHFVLFSSASALLGWRGQGGYAAANAFLDALAQQRHAEGRPALSLDWGPWTIGAAAALDPRQRERWERQGIGRLDPAAGLAALEAAMAGTAPQRAVLAVDWARFAAGAPPGLARGLLSEVLPRPAAPAGRGQLARRLAGAVPGEWRGILVAHLRAEIADILGGPTQPQGASQVAEERLGLFDMGFDSLMALELKNRLEAAIGQSLPPTLAFECPTIAALAEHLAGRLAPAAPPPPLPPPAAPDSLLAEIGDLSERELEAFLDEEFQRSLP